MRTNRAGLTAAIVGLLGVSIIGGVSTAEAQLQYTGCLKDSGKIVRVAIGDSPSKPCKSKQTQIMFSGTDAIDALVEKDMLLMEDVAALQAKDVELTAKDVELMAKDTELTNDVTGLKAKDEQLMAKDTEQDAAISANAGGVGANAADIDAVETKTQALMDKDQELMDVDADLQEQIDLLDEQVAALEPNGEVYVNCPGESLQDAIDAATVGTVILVSGVCNENVVIGPEKTDVTLDGQGAAGINGPSLGTRTINIHGRDIAIRGFAGGITGGRHAIGVFEGGTATIDNNRIQSDAGSGLLINRLGFAVIINNLIENNASDGISLAESSTARIGLIPGEDSPSPNTISNNTNQGIFLRRHSDARINGNIIKGNGRSGIRVHEVSFARIINNTIEGNAFTAGVRRAGILVEGNSGVQVDGNTTTAGMENDDWGLECATNSYVQGNLNTLDGVDGQFKESDNCDSSELTLP